MSRDLRACLESLENSFNAVSYQRSAVSQNVMPPAIRHHQSSIKAEKS
jgi:hypothetical protein